MVSNDLNIFLILVSACIVNNIVLMRFLSLCSFFGLSNSMDASIGMGMAVIFVMVMASSATWAASHFILKPLELEFLRTPIYILVIATLVQLEEMYIKKMFPKLYKSMGIYLPLITTNCAVLGAALLGSSYNLNFVNNVFYALGVSGGYTLAIVLFAAIRERIAIAPVPKVFVGYPISFIAASLMSLAFLGFSHLFHL